MRTKLMATLIAATGTLAAGVPPAAAASACAVPTIDVQRSGAGIALTGRAVALADCRFEARLKVTRSGGGGRMSTSQGGAFDLRDGEVGEVASAGLSMAAGDRLEAQLELSIGGETIATSVLRVGD